MNPQVTAFMRNFINEVKRCDEMERKLRFLIEQLKKEEDFEELYGEGVANMAMSSSVTLDQLEGRLEQEEQELMAANASASLLERNRNELVELKYVLEKDQLFFQEAGPASGALAGNQAEDRLLREDAALLDSDFRDEEAMFAKSALSLGFITGVVESDKFLSFERVLWRATRGNLYLKHTSTEEAIHDLATDEFVKKDVFIIFYQGGRVESKIRKICEAFKANLYPCPESAPERQALLGEVTHRLDEVDVVLTRGSDVRRSILRRIAQEAPSWQEKLRKEKAIFNIMNMMDYDHGRKCLIANGWCPVRETAAIQEALRRGFQRTGSAVPSIMSVVATEEQPPTYFRVNKFTSVFQEMVDAYGVARYGEINPAVFSLATFPFLFAVMYGDVGHGLLMVCFTLPLLLFERRFKAVAEDNEIFGMAFEGRYLLFMMSVAAVYTGFLYNEFFSVPMNIFGSAWSHDNCLPSISHVGGGLVNKTDEVCKALHTYPFGVDPAFRGASNELLFSNSLKMKMSIIIGVVHMSLGIFMHMFNGIKFRKWYNVFCEFVPQVLFMWCLFGYLVVLISFKWTQDYGYYAPPADLLCNGTAIVRSPPSLIGVMISMALPFFNAITCEQEMGLFGQGMKTLQTALLLIAVICIPWMLLLKPILLLVDHKRGIVRDKEHSGDHFQFGEIFVHQMIHAIEFILGTISNTASYLRLWALSLAHSELSIVFYEKALVGLGMSSASSGGFKGVMLLFVTFAIWAGATVGVLVVMEALSAFLHALRLHWVEFQNKFYLGDGKKFDPFVFPAFVREKPDVVDN